uniref:Tripartite motif-containing protein 45-like n=1 Tax=Crassostrea virginica TaxID=6565 RepID=A0A8B8E1P3_CRAVI|nr:tripartite motif-containing protein 45-like [Crassostrea virginica]
MAEAAPLSSENTEVQCDLCFSEVLVNWSCHDCAQNLCDNCQTLHSRSNASKQHGILHLKEDKDEEMESGSDAIDIDEIELHICRIHEENVCELYCNLCDMLVCHICVRSIHKTHNISEIGESAEQKYNQLIKKFEHLEKYELEKARKKVESLERNKVEYVSSAALKRELIKQRNEKLKFELDNLTDNMLKEIETKEEVDLQFINRKQFKLQNLSTKVSEALHFCRNNMSNKSGISLLDACAEAARKIEKLRLPSAESGPDRINPPEFVPGKQDEEFASVFGVLEYEPRPALTRRRTTVAFPHSIKAQVVASFTQKARNGVYSICTTGNGNAMIGTEERIVQVVTITGKVLASIKVDITPYNIACSKLGKDLYLSTWNMEIKKLKNGSFTRFIDTSPFQAQGLCVNEDGEILACLYHKEDQFGKIVRYDSAGKSLQQICSDERRRLMFQNPAKVAASVTRDIAVVDMAKKCVIAVGADGQRKFTYKGLNGGKFEPKCIDCNTLGSILVGDHEDRIHLLDKNGKFLQYIMTPEHGLNDIIGLSSDQGEKRIWVSCYDKVIIATLV